MYDPWGWSSPKLSEQAMKKSGGYCTMPPTTLGHNLSVVMAMPRRWYELPTIC
jgi:hypothetical protein